MQDHVWVVQVFDFITKSWVWFGAKPSRTKARALQKTTALRSRIRKFIAA